MPKNRWPINKSMMKEGFRFGVAVFYLLHKYSTMENGQTGGQAFGKLFAESILESHKGCPSFVTYYQLIDSY
jgi:hypothetical protein